MRAISLAILNFAAAMIDICRMRLLIFDRFDTMRMTSNLPWTSVDYILRMSDVQPLQIPKMKFPFGQISLTTSN